mgnify:CR=1 FL=1
MIEEDSEGEVEENLKTFINLMNHQEWAIPHESP